MNTISLRQTSKPLVSSNNIFTPLELVKRLCDRSEPNVSNVHQRFFEPGCGTGNLIIEVFKRRAAANPVTEANILQVLANIYGLDIDLQNILTARQRIVERIKTLFPSSHLFNYQFWPLVQLFLEQNIFVADFLAPPSTIIFTFWQSESAYQYRGRKISLDQIIQSDREH